MLTKEVMGSYLNLSKEERALLHEAYHGKTSQMKITLTPCKHVVSFDAAFCVYDLYPTILDTIAVYPCNKEVL